MKYIIANWKSHKNQSEAKEWVQELAKTSLSLPADMEVVVAPASSLLAPVAAEIALTATSAQVAPGKSLSLAVQDISQFPAGAYTGAVSGRNLDGLPIKMAILGHSERRRYFHETHQEIANKVDQCLSAGITPLVCVDQEYIAQQAAAIPTEQRSQCLVAYEDLAAIGTGQNTPVSEVQQHFDTILTAFGKVPLIYGGSVNSQNVAEYLEIADGVLIGSASLKVADFVAILDAAA